MAQTSVYNIRERRVQRTSCQYRISLRQTYNDLRELIEDHNRSVPTEDQVRKSAFLLAQELVRMYADVFHRWQTDNLFEVELEDMPALEMNNKLLAEIMMCSERTVYNLRGRLRALGLIVEEVTRGSKKPFKIKLNREMLVIEDTTSKGKLHVVTKHGEKIPQSDQKNERHRKKFPPIGSSTNQNSLEPVLEPIDGKNFRGNLDSSANFSADAPKKPEPDNQNGLPGEQIFPKKQGVEGVFRPARTFQAGFEVLHFQAELIFTAAAAEIFAEYCFDTEQKKRIVCQIMQLYGDLSLSGLQKATIVYGKRLRRMRAYWQQDFGEWPDPLTFFDPTNTKNGFVLTRKWLKEPDKYPDPSPVSTQQTNRLHNAKRRGTWALMKPMDVLLDPPFQNKVF